MNASLAMVVCFAGFQGIVPQTWESASAVAPVVDAAVSGVLGDDALDPTGTVGSSLLVPLGGPDAIDPLDARRTTAGFPVGTRSGAAGAAASTEAAKRPAEGTLFAPLDELVPTSSFGFRTSPITGEAGEFHTGQDYAAPCGTAVYAADAGTVRAVGWHPWGGGNRVEVDHGNGLITSYNHLQGISVAAGDAVVGGAPIAALGTTGSSTGCHLHFETILDGEHVDPLRWKLVPIQHAARTGELKDYAPDGAANSTIPAWAQSSTRSDQPAPAGEPGLSPLAPGTMAGGIPHLAPVPSAVPDPKGAVVAGKPASPVKTVGQQKTPVPPKQKVKPGGRPPVGTPPVSEPGKTPPVVKPPVEPTPVP
ncbi:peptidoglycan DD-metalloendopeptidase family protein, partial [Vibrio cholerae]|nr:peptidoglycan DD-metalloendopeptidase family protein [Vibrio cholerae]